MTRVFIDTGAFVALRNRREREHVPARKALEALVREGVSLFTTNYVFAETYTALLVRVSRHEAISWGRRFRAGRAIELIRVDEEVEEEAWSILQSHEDKAWSYVDATSFVVMQRERSTRAFTFDHNFSQRGLDMVPSPR